MRYDTVTGFFEASFAPSGTGSPAGSTIDGAASGTSHLHYAEESVSSNNNLSISSKQADVLERTRPV